MKCCELALSQPYISYYKQTKCTSKMQEPKGFSDFASFPILIDLINGKVFEVKKGARSVKGGSGGASPPLPQLVVILKIH